LRRIISASVGAGLLVAALAGTAFAGGPPQAGIYVDGELFRTVGTPTDFSGTGAPESSFDTIWNFGGVIPSVADAKPGDRDFNGGRWMVYGASFAEDVTPYEIKDDTELWQAVTDGDVIISDHVLKMFECPVIPMRGKGLNR
jgi:hypothetical protein